MKYKVGDIVKVVDSDDIVTIKGTRGNDYFIGQSWDYLKPPKYSYRVGSSLYIKEKYLEDYMAYQVGDTVWYIDNRPRIKKDIIRNIFEEPKRYTLENAGFDYYENQFKLFPTREALLAAIDPPLHNFVVGQTVWYVEEADDPNTLRVEKGCVISTTNETVEIRIPHPSVPLFNIDVDIVFASPQEAVEKALELKQW